jgi:hypothetical protein
VIAAAGGIRHLVDDDDDGGWRTEPNPGYGRRDA